MSTADKGVPALIDCETAVRALYDYLDGRLAEATTSAVQGHLATCRGCASHFTFARRLLELVPAAMPLAGESGNIRARIVESLKSEGYSRS